MLVRIGNAGDVADGQMGVDDVAGTNRNVSNASGQQERPKSTQFESSTWPPGHDRGDQGRMP
jgi:hypothetical protein